MRIGLLASLLKLESDSDSGIALLYRVLADALAEQGHAVHVVHPSVRPAEATAALRVLNPKWTCDIVAAAPPWPLRLMASRGAWQRHALFERFWVAHRANGALARACLAKDIEIIEAHAFAAPALFFLRRRRRPPVISRLATTTAQMALSSRVSSRALRWLAQAERRAVEASDALLTHSAAHRDDVCAGEGYDPARFTLIPLGLPDPGPPAPDPAPMDAVEFLFVGRFEDRKGIDVLLSAIPKVAAACPRATFVLAGNQASSGAWRAFGQNNPELIRTRVTAPGRVSEGELARLYRKCSVLVAPSRYESFGLIYVEAMSHGKPAIGCRAGGVAEVITDGRTGLLAEAGDPVTLAECMIRLAAEPKLRAEFGIAGRRDFLERFSADRFARRSVEFYKTVKRSLG